MNFIVKDIRDLHTLTNKYHDAQEAFMKAFEAKDADKMEETIKEVTKFEKEILNQLNVDVRVVPSKKGGFIIKPFSNQTKLMVKMVALNVPADIFPNTRLEMVYAEPTRYETEAEAKEQVGPIEFAIFRNYIHGIGARKSQGVA